MSVERRTLLKSTAAGAAVGGPFAGIVAMSAESAEAAAPPNPGALVPIPDERDGAVRLHLPKGFKYRSFHDTEAPITLTDGTALPGRHDGMGAFDGPRRSVILVRNHELNNPPPPAAGAAPPYTHFGPGTPYDEAAGGGTTTIQVTPTGQVIRSFTSLNGTMMNCSGGRMPWGAWITCEETVNGPDVSPDFTGASNVPLKKPHGYVFEVPASHLPGHGQSNRKPITHAGRFAHEAVSYDPKGGHLYLTEDNFEFPSGFYRYRPPRDPMKVGKMLDGGTLQMLKVKGTDNAHLEAMQTTGASYAVEWVDIAEPNVEYDYTPGEVAHHRQQDGHQPRRHPGPGPGGGRVLAARGTGLRQRRRVLHLDPGRRRPDDRARLRRRLRQGVRPGVGLRHQAGQADLRLPVPEPRRPRLPRQRHHVQARHAGGLRGPRLRQLPPRPDPARPAVRHRPEPAGQQHPADATRYNDEFAGTTFSPDGHTLFVNIQASRGMTFAIWGPWAKIGV